MKRLLFWTHRGLVMVTVSLMAVDPAAACRLLERRCCQPCPPAACQPSCTQTVPAPAPEAPPPAAQPSPSDQPPPPPAAFSPAEAGFSRQAASEATPQPPVSVHVPEEMPIVAAPAVPPASQHDVTPPAEPSDMATQPQPLIGARRTPAGPANVDVPQADAPPAAAPLAPVPLEPAAVPVAPTHSVQAAAPAIPELPPRDVAPPGPPATAFPVPTEPTPMSLAAPEVRPMPGELGTGPARVLAPVQAPPAPSAPMPPFPAVDDDPFAPPRPTRPTSPAHAEPSNEPPFQGEVPSSQESTSPASKPSRPTPEEDDPFAPAKPQAGLTPSQDVMPVFASAGKNTPTDLARDADGQLPLRSWVDDTGQFRVQARLIQVLDGHVRLLKTTGRTTTVPLTRLSSADRAYVARAVAYYGQQLLAPQLVAQSPSQP